jgi:hypothetical protein
MLTKCFFLPNLKKPGQAGILKFYRVSVSSPSNISPCVSTAGTGHGRSISFRMARMGSGQIYLEKNKIEQTLELDEELKDSYSESS